MNAAELDGYLDLFERGWVDFARRGFFRTDDLKADTGKGKGLEGITPVLMAFAAAEGFDSAALAPLASGRRSCLGAGAPARELYALRAGVAARGRVAALRLGQAPIVEHAVACKLVSEPMVITEMSGELVTRLDGRPAAAGGSPIAARCLRRPPPRAAAR